MVEFDAMFEENIESSSREGPSEGTATSATDNPRLMCETPVLLLWFEC